MDLHVIQFLSRREYKKRNEPQRSPGCIKPLQGTAIIDHPKTRHQPSHQQMVKSHRKKRRPQIENGVQRHTSCIKRVCWRLNERSAHPSHGCLLRNRQCKSKRHQNACNAQPSDSPRRSKKPAVVCNNKTQTNQARSKNASNNRGSIARQFARQARGLIDTETRQCHGNRAHDDPRGK